MSIFHAQSFQLLERNLAEDRSVTRLLEWSNALDITLPGAYLEWARLGGQEILEKYSNSDWFWFETPELVTTPAGDRGILFHQENQGNFDKIVLLDRGDDPPVLFAWLGEPPWVTYTERFSECVFAQIFDWQYENEDCYSCQIELITDRGIDLLRQQFTELVTTESQIEDDRVVEYRFWLSPELRICAQVGYEGKTIVAINGVDNLAAILEARLLELFADEVLPPAFNSVGWAMSFLSSRLDNGWTTQLRSAFIDKPELAKIELLMSCHRRSPLRERSQSMSFPNTGDSFVIGDRSWGVTIQFRRKYGGWWYLDRLIDES
jgi:hypothetical protein